MNARDLGGCGEVPELRCWPQPDSIITATAHAGTLGQRFCQPVQFLEDGDALVACSSGRDDLERGALGRVSTDGDIRWSVPWPVTSLSSNVVATGPDQWAVARLVPGDVVRRPDGHHSANTGRQLAEIVVVSGDGSVDPAIRFDSAEWAQITALVPDSRGQLVVAGSFMRDLVVGGRAVRAPGYFAGFVAKLSPDRSTTDWVAAISGRSTTMSTVVALADGGVAAIGVARDHVVAGRSRLEHAGYFVFYVRYDARGTIDALQRLTTSAPQAPALPAGEILWTLLDGSVCRIDAATGAIVSCVPLVEVGTAIIEIGGAIPEGTRWFAVPRTSDAGTTAYDVVEAGASGLAQRGSIRERDPFYGTLHMFMRSPAGLIFATGNLTSASGEPYAFASLRPPSSAAD